MRLDIHVFHHFDNQTELMEKLFENTNFIIQKLNQMADELQDLTAEVEETKGIMQSAKVLIEGFKAALDAAIAANNPQALKDLSDSLNTGSEELATALAANPLPGEVVTPPEG